VTLPAPVFAGDPDPRDWTADQWAEFHAWGLSLEGDRPKRKRTRAKKRKRKSRALEWKKVYCFQCGAWLKWWALIPIAGALCDRFCKGKRGQQNGH
jgi:hypothetical protein